MELKNCSKCKVPYPLFMYNRQYDKPVNTCKQCVYERRRGSDDVVADQYYDDLDRIIYDAGFTASIREKAPVVVEEVVEDDRWTFNKVYGYDPDFLQET